MREKDPTYFEHDRPDVLELVPIAAQRVLDVGCGSGRLAAAIKARQIAEVSGIELDRGAAEQARTRLDHVHVGDIESDDFPLPKAMFDCIICGDILEHLRSPSVALKKLRELLSPGGCLIVSVPNVRNHTVIRSLLAGNWTPETAGIQDGDHVQCLTRRELEKLLVRSGFDVEEMRMVPGDGFDDWVKQGRPLDVAVGGLQIRATSQGDAAEFFAYQFLTRSVVKETPQYGLTSIVIVTHNAWSFTKSCVDSIRLGRGEGSCLSTFSSPLSTLSAQPQRASFHEHWYAESELELLEGAARFIRPLKGEIVEIGCWEGRSTSVIANSCFPESVTAVDTWQGNLAEGMNHETVRIARERDVFAIFQENMRLATRGNVVPNRIDAFEFLRQSDGPIKFCHIDAAHDYPSVRDALALILPRLVRGGMLVGHDYDSAHLGRDDLHGGVQRAVRELLPQHAVRGNNWWYAHMTQ